MFRLKLEDFCDDGDDDHEWTLYRMARRRFLQSLLEKSVTLGKVCLVREMVAHGAPKIDRMFISCVMLCNPYLYDAQVAEAFICAVNVDGLRNYRVWIGLRPSGWKQSAMLIEVALLNGNVEFVEVLMTKANLSSCSMSHEAFQWATSANWNFSLWLRLRTFVCIHDRLGQSNSTLAE